MDAETFSDNGVQKNITASAKRRKVTNNKVINNSRKRKRNKKLIGEEVYDSTETEYSESGIESVAEDETDTSELLRMEPTVKDFNNFKASDDFDILAKLLLGTNENEKAILDLLSKRSNKQRRLIARYFMMEHGRDFVAELRDKLGKGLEDIIIGLMIPNAEYLCRELLKAMKTQDNQVFIDILCTQTSTQVKEIVRTYYIMFRAKVTNHLSIETEENFKKFITFIISGVRKNSKHADSAIVENGSEENYSGINKEHIKSDKKEASKCSTKIVGKSSKEHSKELARQLYEACEEKDGIDHNVYSKILSHESFDELKSVMEEYNKITCRTLEQTIKAEVTGPLRDAYMAVVESAVNQATYLAKALNKALDTNVTTFKRIIISRSEIDLGDIKKEYERLYGRKLTNVIKEEVTGPYKNVLLSLVGEC